MVVVQSGPGIRGLFAVPHGVLSIVPMIVAPVALALNIIATLTCNFLERIYIEHSYSGAAFDDEGNVTHIDLDTTRARQMFGLRYWQCESQGNPGSFEFAYPDGSLSGQDRLTDDEIESDPFNPFTDPDFNEQTEEKFRAAIAFGFVAVLLGGVTMLFVHLATCISYNRLVLKMMGTGFTLACVFAFLMLTAFSAEMCDSDICVDDYRNQTRVKELDLDIPLDDVCNEGCRMGPGAGMALAAGIFWFVAAVVTCLIPADKTDEDESEDKDASAPASAEEQAPLVNQQEPEVIYQYEDEQGNVHQGTPPVPPPAAQQTGRKAEEEFEF